MGCGNKGLYSDAYTENAVPGSADYMKPTDPFSKYIKGRKDVDVNGFYDVVAHGSENRIVIEHNGTSIEVDHRTAAKLFKANKDYNRGAIRLLSCNTGKVSSGFAQNLCKQTEQTS